MNPILLDSLECSNPNDTRLVIALALATSTLLVDTQTGFITLPATKKKGSKQPPEFISFYRNVSQLQNEIFTQQENNPVVDYLVQEDPQTRSAFLYIETIGRMIEQNTETVPNNQVPQSARFFEYPVYADPTHIQSHEAQRDFHFTLALFYYLCPEPTIARQCLEQHYGLLNNRSGNFYQEDVFLYTVYVEAARALQTQHGYVDNKKLAIFGTLGTEESTLELSRLHIPISNSNSKHPKYNQRLINALSTALKETPDVLHHMDETGHLWWQVGAALANKKLPASKQLYSWIDATFTAKSTQRLDALLCALFEDGTAEHQLALLTLPPILGLKNHPTDPTFWKRILSHTQAEHVIETFISTQGLLKTHEPTVFERFIYGFSGYRLNSNPIDQPLSSTDTAIQTICEPIGDMLRHTPTLFTDPWKSFFEFAQGHLNSTTLAQSKEEMVRFFSDPQNPHTHELISYWAWNPRHLLSLALLCEPMGPDKNDFIDSKLSLPTEPAYRNEHVLEFVKDIFTAFSNNPACVKLFYQEAASQNGVSLTINDALVPPKFKLDRFSKDLYFLHSYFVASPISENNMEWSELLHQGEKKLTLFKTPEHLAQYEAWLMRRISAPQTPATEAGFNQKPRTHSI